GNLEGLNVNSWKTLISPEVVNQTCIYQVTPMEIYCSLCNEPISSGGLPDSITGRISQTPHEHTESHGRQYSLPTSLGGFITTWGTAHWLDSTSEVMPPEVLA
ncbi:MAG: hypothetical protein LBJ95_03030, partial [Oscillospiraceae bacterium]|nr:hypothetical protein [Oscillospiraceae bacterium]